MTAGDRFAHGMAVDDLARRIHERMLNGDLPAGTWLRQESLAAEFRVSRTPIREALRKLQAEGIVVVSPNRGARVRWPTATEAREAYVVRAELEGLAARLAAATPDPRLLQRLVDAVALFPHAGDESSADAAAGRAAWQEANNRFHDAIIDFSDNARLRRTITELHRSFPRNLTWAALEEDDTLFDRSAGEHQTILDAVAAGDPSLARARMIEHVLSAAELVASWFERHSPADALSA